MTCLILKSQAAQFKDFPAAVQAYVDELNYHADHMKAVAAHNEAASEHEAAVAAEHVIAEEAARVGSAPDIEQRAALARARRVKAHSKMTGHQAYPAPLAHQIVAAAVRPDGDKYVVDYEIVDVIPVAPADAEGLQRRKNELLVALSDDRGATMGAIVSPVKWNLKAYRYREVLAADEDRRAKILVGVIKRQNELAVAGKEVPTVTQDEIEKKVMEGRSKVDHEFASEFEAMQIKLQAIERHALEMHAQIEDLTEDNAHTWKPEPFPTN